MALAKITELRAINPSSSELDYLAWTLGAPGAKDYLSKITPKDLPDAGAILDVALEYIELANETRNQAEREAYLARATAFLDKADLEIKELPLTKFVRGELEAAEGHLDDAKSYYEEALKLDRDFPRAKNNIGTMYATMTPADFVRAADKFEEVATMVGIPIRTQRTAHINSGEAYIETGKNDAACVHWQKAATLSKTLPGDFHDVDFFYTNVMCNAVRGNLSESLTEFRKMPNGNAILSKVLEGRPGPRAQCLLKAIAESSLNARCNL